MTDTKIFPQPAWLAGAGNMGSALIEGWRACGYDLSNITVIRPSGAAIEGVRVVKSVKDAGSAPKFVILAVKPQQLAEVAAQLRPHLSAQTVLVSTLAGAELATLRRQFPGVRAIVRAMPNVGVAVRRGVIGLIGDGTDIALEREIATIFQPLGYAPWVADEARLAALGAVAGAGPAYVARFVQALAKAGEKLGLSEELASSIALETVFGTAWLGASAGQTMDRLVAKVASPNGTTEAGLAVLDRDGGLDALVSEAIEAADRRGKELAMEAEGASLAAEATLH